MLRPRTSAFVGRPAWARSWLPATGHTRRQPASGPRSRRRRPRPRARRRVSRGLFRAISRAGDAVRRARPPPRRADRQLARRPRAWEATRGRLARRGETDRSGGHRRAPLRATYAIVREALEASAAKRVCRDELWTVSQLNGWQVTLRLPRDDSAGRHRRGAQGRAGALERACRSTSTPKSPTCARAQARLHRAEAERSHRHRPDAQPGRDAAHGFAVRLAGAARQDAGVRQAFDALVREQIDPACTRYADFLETDYLPAAREAIARLGQPRTARPATTRASCYHSSLAEDGERGARDRPARDRAARRRR